MKEGEIVTLCGKYESPLACYGMYFWVFPHPHLFTDNVKLSRFLLFLD